MLSNLANMFIQLFQFSLYCFSYVVHCSLISVDIPNTTYQCHKLLCFCFYVTFFSLYGFTLYVINMICLQKFYIFVSMLKINSSSKSNPFQYDNMDEFDNHQFHSLFDQHIILVCFYCQRISQQNRNSQRMICTLNNIEITTTFPPLPTLYFGWKPFHDDPFI